MHQEASKTPLVWTDRQTDAPQGCCWLPSLKFLFWTHQEANNTPEVKTDRQDQFYTLDRCAGGNNMAIHFFCVLCSIHITVVSHADVIKMAKYHYK